MIEDEDRDAYGATAAAEVPQKREPALNLPLPVTVSLGIILVFQIFISLSDYIPIGRYLAELIYYYGGFISARYTSEQMSGDLSWIWTPVSYSLLHGGWEHLLFNGAWLVIFGSPVARRIGGLRYTLFWIVTAALSALGFFLFNPSSPSLLVGASGVISALTGAACRFVWSPRRSFGAFARSKTPLLSIREALTNRSVLSFVAVWFAANVVFAAFGSVGGAMAIAWQAHLGGFLAGFFLFPAFDRKS